MTSNEERKGFWNTLMEAHDASEETSRRIASAIPAVSTLCRFRTVNEHTLDQLQSNRLFFSSADYYDDPFDTYFYIDHAKIQNAVNTLRYLVKSGGKDGIKDMLSIAGISPHLHSAVNYALEHATSEVPDTSYFFVELSSIRDSLLKSCYSICFCDDPYNESLWLKYGNAHKGFVQVYDMANPDTVLCNKSERCHYCMFRNSLPSIYPVYYSDERYDATRYAMTMCTYRVVSHDALLSSCGLADTLLGTTPWEIERISLIKKRCHEYDGEWRMICPHHPEARPAIGMKPAYIALGLRMPKYERRMVISAARVAGIECVAEMYIDDNDHLNMRKTADATTNHQ